MGRGGGELSGPRESSVPTTDDRLNHDSGHRRADGGKRGEVGEGEREKRGRKREEGEGEGEEREREGERGR